MINPNHQEIIAIPAIKINVPVGKYCWRVDRPVKDNCEHLRYPEVKHWECRAFGGPYYLVGSPKEGSVEKCFRCKKASEL